MLGEFFSHLSEPPFDKGCWLWQAAAKDRMRVVYHNHPLTMYVTHMLGGRGGVLTPLLSMDVAAHRDQRISMEHKVLRSSDCQQRSHHSQLHGLAVYLAALLDERHNLHTKKAFDLWTICKLLTSAVTILLCSRFLKCCWLLVSAANNKQRGINRKMDCWIIQEMRECGSPETLRCHRSDALMRCSLHGGMRETPET